MKNSFFISLILLITLQNAGADWFQQNSGINLYMNDVKFLNANTGYVGADGLLLKTTDGGNNWNQIIVGSSATLIAAIFIFDADNIILASYGSKMFRTNDGCATFDSAFSGIYGPGAIFFPSRDTGYSNSKYDGVFKTVNGGMNWVNIYPPVSQLQGGVHFINNQTGFVTGGTNTFSILKTTTGGSTWDLQNLGTNTYIFDIQFVNNSTGYCVGQSNTNRNPIYKTTDLGISWVLQYEALSGYNSVSFVNESTGYASCFHSYLSKTTNGGMNWITYTNPVLFTQVNKIDFADPETGYMITANGRILKTTDGGTVGVQQINELVPENFSLQQNYPNPFNPNTIIGFQLAVKGNVKLIVYDILGNEVIELVDEKKSPGSYETEFIGNNLPSGIYFYKLQIDNNFVDTKRMVLLK
ncbi:MAG: YCF48-related protein [bacterium]